MKICIPIREKNAAQVVKRIKLAARNADFIEIWLDDLNENEIARVINASDIKATKNGTVKKGAAKKPVIAVCRGKVEKGNFRGREIERIERLIFAVKNGAKFVDVGIHTAPALIAGLKKTCRKYGAKMIISSHIWSGTPSLPALLKICARAQKLNADIIKIATTISRWSDNVILFELTRRIAARGLKIITIGMGEKGKISRLGCPILGSFLTYVALNKESKTAPGQMVIRDLTG